MRYKPSALVVVSVSKLVATLVAVTCAFATTAPVLSVTVPVNVAVSWAKAGTIATSSTAKACRPL